MITNKTSHYWVGLDVGKKEFFASVDIGTEEKPVNILKLPCRKFNNTEKGVVNFLAWIDKQIPDSAFKIAMEATGCYSINLCKMLQAEKEGLKCSILNPYLTSNFLKSLNLPHKTDKIDAQGIARFGKERQPEATSMPSKDEEDLKALSRQRDFMVKKKTDFKNRAQTLSNKLAKKIHEDSIKEMEKGILRLEKEMKKLANKISWAVKQMNLMRTIPGVGETTAVSLTAELGDFNQYSRKQFSSASGLVPKNEESGSSVKKSRISKRAPGRIRQLLYMNSMGAVKDVPFLGYKYNEFVSKGKTPLQARCACMRLLMELIRSVVVNEKPYSKEISMKSLGKSLITA